MARPVVSVTAERLYEALGPMQDQDDVNGWVLLHFCDALTRDAADVEALVAETDTQAGWGPLLDPTTCPVKALPFLAMFSGAVVTPQLSETQIRALIKSSPAQARGTPAAIVGAAQLWLTGTKFVGLTERAGGDAYAVTVTVYESEVIDVTQITAAVKAAMPAGLNLTFTVSPGWTIAQMETALAANNVAYVEANWATVNNFERQHP